MAWRHTNQALRTDPLFQLWQLGAVSGLAEVHCAWLLGGVKTQGGLPKPRPPATRKSEDRPLNRGVPETAISELVLQSDIRKQGGLPEVQPLATRKFEDRPPD